MSIPVSTWIRAVLAAASLLGIVTTAAAQEGTDWGFYVGNNWNDDGSWFGDAPDENTDAYFQGQSVTSTTTDTAIVNHGDTARAFRVFVDEGAGFIPFDINMTIRGSGAANSTLDIANEFQVSANRPVAQINRTLSQAKLELLKVQARKIRVVSTDRYDVGNAQALLTLKSSTTHLNYGFEVAGSNSRLAVDGGSLSWDSSNAQIDAGSNFNTWNFAKISGDVKNDGVWTVGSGDTRFWGDISGTGRVSVSLPTSFLRFNKSYGTGGAVNVDQSIVGMGGVKIDDGQVTFTKSNSFTGGLHLNGGSLSVDGGSQTGGLGNTIYMNGGSLRLNSNMVLVPNAVEINGESEVAISDHDVELRSPLRGDSILEKRGSGRLTLTGNNDFRGQLTVRQGSVVAGGQSLGNQFDLSLPFYGTSLTLSDHSQLGTLSGHGDVSLGDFDLTLNNSVVSEFQGDLIGNGAVTHRGQAITLSGDLSQFQGQLTASGAGLTLTDSALRTYAGALDAYGGGRLIVDIDNDWQTYVNERDVRNFGTIVFRGGRTRELTGGLIGGSNGTIEVQDGRLKANRLHGSKLKLGDGAVFESMDDIFAGAVEMQGGQAELDIDHTMMLLSAGTGIQGYGTLQKTGSGILALSADSEFQGTVRLQSGSISLSANAPNTVFDIASNRSVNQYRNGTLDIGGLSGSGSYQLFDLAHLGIVRKVRLGGNDLSSTFHGTIDGYGTVTKTGSGNFDFRGTNSNSWLEIEQGTLTLGSQAFGRGVGLSDQTTLRLSGSIDTNSSLALRGGSMVIDTQSHDLVHRGGISNSGSNARLIKLGSGKLEFTGASPFYGDVVLKEGTLAARPEFGDRLLFRGGTFQSGQSNFDWSDPIDVQATGSAFSLSGGATLKITGDLTGFGELRKLGSGYLHLAGNGSAFRGTLGVENGVLTVDTADAVGRSTNFNVGDSGTLQFRPNQQSIILDGMIAGSGTVQKRGSGELVFRGDASGLETTFSVFSGTLTGSGEFGDLAIRGGTLAPGESPGILTAENFDLAEAAVLAIELGGLQAGTEYDQLQIFGDAALAGTLDVTLINGFTLAEDQEFLIADIAGALSGQFKGLDEGYQVGSFDNQALYITYNAGNGNSIALFTSVPEPANFLPLCICLFWRMNRRRRA